MDGLMGLIGVAILNNCRVSFAVVYGRHVLGILEGLGVTDMALQWFLFYYDYRSQ